MRHLVLVVLLALSACAASAVPAPSRRACCPLETVAPVKTCGCKVDASCGDCCGPEHCKCSPN